MKKIMLALLAAVSMMGAYAQQMPELEENNPPRIKKMIKGSVADTLGRPLAGAMLYLSGTSIGAVTDERGKFHLSHGERDAELVVSYIGYLSQVKRVTDGVVHFVLQSDVFNLEQVEVFGARHRQPEKLSDLTRMPLRTSEQLQSISVVSDELIKQQGNLTLGDVTRNVVGVSTFATYGGASESLTARGFRGLPTLKNGVRVHSDFRGQGMLTDMQGVESVQVVKGSAAVTQGIGNDIGSAGGTVNIATKTPKYTNSGEVSLRAGSWGLVRPTFDFQGVAGQKDNLGFRLNGAIERSDSYRKHVSKDRIYINPSFAWRISPRTTLTVEMDYLHDSRTPDRGTVNLAADSVNALYDMPNDKFLGFATDRIFTNQTSYSARLEHKLTDNLSVRAVVAGSTLNTDNTGASTSKLFKAKDYNMLKRSLGRSQRSDKNQVIQFDLVGRDLYTGPIKHTFQVGIDYRRSVVGTTSYGAVVVDTINILESIPNYLPREITLARGDETGSTAYSYGIMAQDVISFNRYAKLVLGARYSYGNSYDNEGSGAVYGDAFNPILGVIVTPIKGMHLFGSYTTTTNLRSAANLMVDGTPIGASTTTQWETGLKSEWLSDRLRFNLTLFQVMNRNLAYSVYDEAGQATGRSDKAGDLRRRGIETEVTGRLFKNLQVIVGYAYLDAKYQNSPAYVDGSAPMNAPNHTANGWIYYTLGKSVLKGLSVGFGAYYVGERPVGEHTKKTTHTNTTPGVRPFNMKAYTTLNATVGYAYKNMSANVVFNNILNEIGYSSYYRGGYINPTDPFNCSATLTYRF